MAADRADDVIPEQASEILEFWFGEPEGGEVQPCEEWFQKARSSPPRPRLAAPQRDPWQRIYPRRERVSGGARFLFLELPVMV